MKRTRVEIYEKYRADINNMSFDKQDESERKEECVTNRITHTHSVQEIMDKFDEYTVMIDSAEISENKINEEKRKKQIKMRKIKTIAIYSVLGILIIGLIVLIICLLRM